MEVGKTLWTAPALRAAQRGIRKRFIKDKRFEGTFSLAFDAPTGTLRMEVHPGPVVQLKAEGAHFLGAFFGQKRLADLLPFTRSERYSPDQVDEGDRAIQRYFVAQGYPEVVCDHRMEVLKGTVQAPEEIQLTYRVQRGQRFKVKAVRLDGNEAVPTSDLKDLLDPPAGGSCSRPSSRRIS